MKAAEEFDQEEAVLQRADEIRAARDSFARPMPPAHEPKRTKVHWDFLLEEMSWLAKEFIKCVTRTKSLRQQSLTVRVLSMQSLRPKNH